MILIDAEVWTGQLVERLEAGALLGVCGEPVACRGQQTLAQACRDGKAAVRSGFIVRVEVAADRVQRNEQVLAPGWQRQLEVAVAAPAELIEVAVQVAQQPTTLGGRPQVAVQLGRRRRTEE